MSRNITHGNGVLRIATANQIFIFVCFYDNRFEILIRFHKYLDADKTKAASILNSPRFLQRVFKI